MKIKVLMSTIACVLLLSGCSDVLDRPSQTTAEDDSYWTSEEKVRLYANDFYPNFFVGYGVKYGTVGYTPNANYMFNDDAVIKSTQRQFSRSVPTELGSTSEDLMWQSQYAGPTWNFAWIRKANLMLARMERNLKGNLSDEQMAHWQGVGRFFRAWEYARLVDVFGDVPYYNKEITNLDKDELYKDRTPRNEVMDEVYKDFEYALANVRLNDGDQYVNRYVVAALVSRCALFEASWQKYYYKNNERAAKFLRQAIAAAEVVMNSGKYDIVEEFRALFASTDLVNSKDVIFYRKYDAAQGITHSIASTCNMESPTDQGPNLDLIKAFICTDGKDWQTSGLETAKDFSIANLLKTRDPRFEASFYPRVTSKSRSSYLYISKFIPRSALDYVQSGASPGAEFKGDKNITGYPVLRYAEVLLNWIEAKAEYATLGGPAVTQADIDKSINKIRNRPIADEAKKMGVTKVVAMDLAQLNDDPKRDADVPQLIWEIRRERRMEFAFEASRISDLRRWKKLSYMDTDANADLLTGTWVNFPVDAVGELNAANKGKLRVLTAAGKFVVYDGSNGSQMVGFFYPVENKGRLPFLNIPNVNPYLSPIGINTIAEYATRGYKLTQTEGWPSSY